MANDEKEIKPTVILCKPHELDAARRILNADVPHDDDPEKAPAPVWSFAVAGPPIVIAEIVVNYDDKVDSAWNGMTEQERGQFAKKPEVDYYGPCPVCGGSHFLTARSLVPVPYENGNGVCTRCHEKSKDGGECEA